jgi:hypothetical protein
VRASSACSATAITTDHISPAGDQGSPAGKYLPSTRCAADFNSYGARRGNHEVMMRGTFANIRIKNEMVPGVEGGVTKHIPSGEQMPIYDAAMKYKAEGVPLVIFAGKEYGTGSSRDWAAKGTNLLGVKRRDRRELRAHPPLEPGRHGRAAAAVLQKRRHPALRPAQHDESGLSLLTGRRQDFLGHEFGFGNETLEFRPLRPVAHVERSLEIDDLAIQAGKTPSGFMRVLFLHRMTHDHAAADFLAVHADGESKLDAFQKRRCRP